MPKPRITVIVPVFNASRYLEEALDSVIQQGFSDWEVCAVDDGSTDSSLEILQAYTEKDGRIRYFRQEHAGAAAARIRALQEGRGEYVFCLDADDVLSADALQEMERKASQSGADIVIPDMEMYWTTARAFRWNEKMKIDTQQVLRGEEAFARTFPWEIHALMLMKYSLMRTYYVLGDLTAPCFNADEYLSRKCLLFAQKVVYSGGVYFYRCHPASITHQSEAFRFEELDAISAYLTLAKDTSPEVKRKVEREMIAILFHLFSKAHQWKRDTTDSEPLQKAQSVFFAIRSLRPRAGRGAKQRLIYRTFCLNPRLFSLLAFFRSFFL